MEESLYERARDTRTAARAPRESMNQNHFTVVTTDTEPMYKLIIHTDEAPTVAAMVAPSAAATWPNSTMMRGMVIM